MDCLRAASAGSELPVQNIDNAVNVSEIPKSNSRIHEQLINARDSITAARQYLAEIEDYCANEPINIENLKLLSYGRSAIKALELAVDSADRTLFFGSKIEQEKRYSLSAGITRSAEKYGTPILLDSGLKIFLEINF